MFAGSKFTFKFGHFKSSRVRRSSAADSWPVSNATVIPAAFAKSVAGDLSGGDAERIDNIILVQAFHAGDDWIRAVVREAAGRLGQGLAAIHLTLGIETFIVTGGFAQALGPDYRSLLVEGAQAAGWDLGQDWDRMIRFGAAADDDVLVGAGRYAAFLAPASRRMAGE